jgi:sulfur-oxidizing protein SoxB
MITRRELLQVGAATAAQTVGGGIRRTLAQQRLTQDELTRFDALGNVTLLHVTDIHGQLMPVHFREPSVNLGVGEAKGLPPHLTGTDFLTRFGIAPKSAAAYAMTDQDFAALAASYGKIGGLDRLATVVRQVRSERDGKVLLLDGGDTWQGSLSANASRGQDMVDCMALLKPDAMTGHWEFTYGEARMQELIKSLDFPFLALNIRDTEWNEPVFDAGQMGE